MSDILNREHGERTTAVKKMFSDIAPTYDLLNRLLSFGIDVGWRKRLVSHLPKGRLKVLDLASGTFDVALQIVKSRPEAVVYAQDLSPGMLKAGLSKIAKAGKTQSVFPAASSAEDLPLGPEQFDAVSIAFGIRNVARRERALAEMARVLKPGGVVLILDFSLPKNPVVRAFYGFYFHRVLPLLGGIVSGNFVAYRYLPKSVAGFPPREDFIKLMQNAGFADVTYEDLTLGVATLYKGVKK